MKSTGAVVGGAQYGRLALGFLKKYKMVRLTQSPENTTKKISSCPATVQWNHLGLVYLLVLFSETGRNGKQGRAWGPAVCAQIPFSFFVWFVHNILKHSHNQILSQKDEITEQQATDHELRLLGTEQFSQPIKIQACALRPRVNATFDGWCPHAHQSLDQERLSKLSWMQNERNLSLSSTALRNSH